MTHFQHKVFSSMLASSPEQLSMFLACPKAQLNLIRIITRVETQGVADVAVLLKHFLLSFWKIKGNFLNQTV